VEIDMCGPWSSTAPMGMATTGCGLRAIAARISGQVRWS
jgi:hypothetical protein